MIFFQDVTGGNDPTSANCIAHIRPFAEMADDLAANDVADYTFITPDLCNDMHDQGCETQADGWLSREVPAIQDSAAYQAGGVIFVTWDEGGQGNEPIGMIVLSSLAKAGYANNLAYCHASLVRTIQEIFDLKPYLREANKVADLSDLFVPGVISG